MAILIEPAELAERLGRPESTRPVVLDVRWTLAEPDGRAAFRAGHIPGAVYVDLDAELADHTVTGAGRHPLPSEAAFTRAMRRWGLRNGDAVVVADDAGGTSAARAWWLLRHAGVTDVRILDGALAAWRAAGLPLEQGDVEPEPGDATAHFGSMPVIDLDEADALASTDHGVLLDARAGERYRGEVEPVDPRAGHIPGAVSAPTVDNLDADGRFRPAAELRARFAALGIDGAHPVAAYCGSGVTAAHEVAALAMAGIDAALYPGSFSQWSNHPERPVATGPRPEGDPD
ncbi:sulfurtransferase [Agromyces aurantiacus]|uniref:Sulfurtransferase n=1 Tax=Agromyces aurantiacus TaxID=165814 RepID=A0ABV9R0R8_9MICO|nr:sulfurtransferase [Agromyces aurantiacus]MBM7506013.1 thiosulfate/3-mercaptopyruvate sulfurtransferase [Agromyces aurantiacus]